MGHRRRLARPIRAVASGFRDASASRIPLRWLDTRRSLTVSEIKPTPTRHHNSPDTATTFLMRRNRRTGYLFFSLVESSNGCRSLHLFKTAEITRSIGFFSKNCTEVTSCVTSCAESPPKNHQFIKSGLEKFNGLVMEWSNKEELRTWTRRRKRDSFLVMRKQTHPVRSGGHGK